MCSEFEKSVLLRDSKMNFYLFFFFALQTFFITQGTDVDVQHP